MRRSDFDITDRIRTTDAIDVCDAVVRQFRDLFPDRFVFGPVFCSLRSPQVDRRSSRIEPSEPLQPSER